MAEQKKNTDNANESLATSKEIKDEHKKSSATFYFTLVMMVVFPLFCCWGCDELSNRLFDDDSENTVWTIDNVPNTRLKSDMIHVSDPDSIIDDIYEDSINVVLSAIRNKTDIFVVALNKVDGQGDVFANDLFRKWGIGDKNRNNGVLVLMTMEPHFIRIETGYGMEEILPDVVCHRIIRDNVKPDFKQERYGEGLLKCAKSLSYVVAGTEYNDIVKVTVNSLAQSLDGDVESDDDYSYSEESWGDLILYLITGWYFVSIFFAPLLSLYHIYLYWKIGKDYNANKKESYNMACAKASTDSLSHKHQIWYCIFVPLSVATAIWFLLIGNYFRRKKRICPKCGKKMRRLSEAEEDTYMSEVQIEEEKRRIIDYDVWLCECGETVIDYYEDSNYEDYEDCPHCGSRMMKVTERETLIAATTTHAGSEKVRYRCEHCGKTQTKTVEIPKLSESSGGGDGSSSDSGGSFGGGDSGGGGSSSSW